MEGGSNSSQSVGVHPDPRAAAKVAEEIVREAEAPVEVGAGAEDLAAGLGLWPPVNPGPSPEPGLDLRSEAEKSFMFVMVLYLVFVYQSHFYH